MTGARIGLPLTRITGLNPDGRIDIDHDLIPPIINYQASSLMCTRLSWINDLIRMRADSLAERLTGSDNHGHEAAEVSDYLLLQILNRFEPLLTHRRKPRWPRKCCIATCPNWPGNSPPMCVHKRDGPLNTKSTNT